MKTTVFVITVISLFGLFVPLTQASTSLKPNFIMPTPPPIPTPPPWPNHTSRPTSTPRPTAFPTSSPKPTSTPQSTVAPTATPKPSVSPKPTPTPTSSPATNTKKDYIMNAINNYRASQGLSAIKTDPYTCGFATTRAKEISTDFSHDGFSNRVNNKTLPYPSYHLLTENIAMTSNYQNVVNMWANSPGHAANMRAATPYICVEFFGNYYAFEGWKP